LVDHGLIENQLGALCELEGGQRLAKGILEWRNGGDNVCFAIASQGVLIEIIRINMKTREREREREREG